MARVHRLRASALTVACACASAAVHVHAQAAPPRRVPADSPSRATIVARIDSLFDGYLESELGPAGIAVAVVRGNDTLALRGYGFADVTHRLPVAATTTFRIGSMTKQFTAAAIMRMVERGRLALTDSIGASLPGLPRAWQRVTVEQLLNHTGGLPDYSSNEGRWRDTLTPDGLVRIVANKKLSFTPGTSWDYSNTDYLLLGMLAEKLYGKSYATIVQDEFARPLGLAHTRYCEDAAGANGQAMGYRRSAHGYEVPRYRNMSQPFASGGLCSTAGDIVAWNRALHLGHVVSATSYARMTTPAGSAQKEGYGFGLRMVPMSGHATVMHSGAEPGFFVTNAWLPADSLSLTILTNTSPSRADAVLRQLARVALGMRQVIPVAMPEVDGKALAKYRGEYTLQLAGRVASLRVDVRDGALTMQASGQARVALFTAGPHTFGTSANPTTQLTFVVEGDRVVRLRYEEGGFMIDGVRVK